MKINIAHDDAGLYLTVELNRNTEPAGPRLFKGGIIPEIKFRHSDHAQAVIAARKLQEYVDGLQAKARKKSTATGAHSD